MDFVRKNFFYASVPLIAFSVSRYVFDGGLTLQTFLWCLSAIGILCLCEQNYNIIKHPIVICFGGYLFFTCLSGLFAINTGEWIYETLRTILMVIYLILIVSVIDRDKTAKTMCLIALAYAVFGIVQYAQWITMHTPDENPLECSGFLSNRNLWTSMQVLLIPFCVYCMKFKKWRFVAIPAVFLLVSNITVLFCRSSYIALMAGAISVSLFNKKLLKITIPLVVLGILYAVFFRMDLITNSESLLQRKYIWGGTLNMLKDRPLGVGAGNWAVAIPPYISNVPIKNLNIHLFFQRPHNDFIWAFSETGIFGGMFYLGIFLTGLWYAFKKKDVFIFSGIMIYCVDAFFSFPRERPIHTMVLLIYLALLIPKSENWVMMKFERSYFAFKQETNKLITCGTLTILLMSLFCFAQRYNTDRLMNIVNNCNDDWGQYIKQTDKFSELATIDKFSIPVQWYRGLAFIKLGSYGLAESAFKKALEANPNSINALNDIAVCRISVKDLEGAKGYLRKALEIAPDANDIAKNLKALEGLDPNDLDSNNLDPNK